MRPKGVTKGVVADLNAPQPELIDLRRRDRPTLASFTPAPRRAGFFFANSGGMKRRSTFRRSFLSLSTA